MSMFISLQGVCLCVCIYVCVFTVVWAIKRERECMRAQMPPHWVCTFVYLDRCVCVRVCACGRSQRSVVQQVTWLAGCSVCVQCAFSLQANLMQPSIPTETCCTGWLTALSGKALRWLMPVSLAFWLFFNTVPVCLPDLSLQVLSFFLSACTYFGSLPS